MKKYFRFLSYFKNKYELYFIMLLFSVIFVIIPGYFEYLGVAYFAGIVAFGMLYLGVEEIIKLSITYIKKVR